MADISRFTTFTNMSSCDTSLLAELETIRMQIKIRRYNCYCDTYIYIYACTKIKLTLAQLVVNICQYLGKLPDHVRGHKLKKKK